MSVLTKGIRIMNAEENSSMDSSSESDSMEERDTQPRGPLHHIIHEWESVFGINGMLEFSKFFIYHFVQILSGLGTKRYVEFF